MIKNLKNWSNTFNSKIAKFCVFWGSLSVLIGAMSTLGGGVWWLYEFGKDLSTFSKDKKEIIISIEYLNFCTMQNQSILHEQLETKIILGVQVEETHANNQWRFDTVRINGVLKPIPYSAVIRNKGKSYVVEMNGNHKKIQ